MQFTHAKKDHGIQELPIKTWLALSIPLMSVEMYTCHGVPRSCWECLLWCPVLWYSDPWYPRWAELNWRPQLLLPAVPSETETREAGDDKDISCFSTNSTLLLTSLIYSTCHFPLIKVQGEHLHCYPVVHITVVYSMLYPGKLKVNAFFKSCRKCLTDFSWR